MNWHKLLQLQVNQYLSSDIVTNKEVQLFVEAVNDTYHSYERQQLFTIENFAAENPDNSNTATRSLLNTQGIGYNASLPKLQEFRDENNIETADAQMLKRLSFVANANPNGIIFFNAEGAVSWANDSFLKLTGYAQSDIPGITLLKLFQGALTDRLTIKKIMTYFNAGSGFDTEVIHYRKDGSWFWARVNAQSVKDDLGNVQEYFAIVENVNVVRLQREHLKMLSNIPAKTSVGICITDKNFEIIWINESFKHMYGYTRSELKGKTLMMFSESVANTRANKTILSQVHHQQSFKEEIISHKKDLPDFWTAISGQPAYDDNNEYQGYFIFTNDITIAKNEMEGLYKKEEKYRDIITKLNFGILEVDKEFNIIYANQRFCEMSGYLMDELTYKTTSRTFFVDNNFQLLKHKMAFRRMEISDGHEISIVNKKGALRWWYVSAAPRYDDSGGFLGSSGIFMDITVPKTLEIDLIKARKQAEESSTSKEHFLANMSHEIRTPMNAILGMSTLLGKTTLDPKQVFYLSTINTASENLLVIINDILDLSKIEAGKISLETIGFNLLNLMNKAVQSLSYKAEEKGLHLSISHFDQHIMPVLIGDPYRFNQVILNLLSNAIKFTENGEVTLTCEALEKMGPFQKIKVQVRDTGKGMDEDFVQHLFEKFSQENESVTRLYGGTGLGMSICKELIDLMDGQILVDSKKGIGTTISVIVEFDIGSPADLPDKSIGFINANVLRNKKILVVDDNEMNRLVAIAMLENFGAVTQEAKNGEEAINAVLTNDLDVVLMDIQMPVMSGIDASRMIRRDISSSLPIIALTATAVKGESDKCLAAGMNDFLVKPFQEEELINIITRWLGKENGKKVADINKKASALYDLSTLIKVSRGNESFVKKMVELFLVQIPEAVEIIKKSAENGQFETIYLTVHRIKPVLHNMGIESLKEDLNEIESLAFTNNHSARLSALIINLEDTITKIAADVKTKI